MITKIIIPAKWSTSNGSAWADVQHNAKAIFEHGLGPCGKTVDGLEIEITEQFVLVSQFCVDGEVKVFYYRIADLTGRIEVEYAKD